MEIPKPDLHFIDYLIVCLYLVFALGVGFVFSKKASKGSEAYFLGGRSLPWWAIGISMVATSFASDTPLAVTEIVRKYGLQRLWWILAWVIMLIVGIFLFARLWRRAKVITDAEFYELRYTGKAATFLRSFRAFFSGIVQNLLIMAGVTFAMTRIMATMTGIDSKLAIGLCVLVATIYALMSGFYGVVVTDVVQFFLATVSMGILAFLAISHAGGLESMLDKIAADPAYGKDTLRIFPDFTTLNQDVLTLLVFIGIMWWSDANGYNMQRMSACRNERDSVKATIFYSIFQAARPWLWVTVALASIYFYPTLPTGYKDTDAYPLVMNLLLGPGLKGLLITAFLAAFMSTIDTHLNWGASYVMTDFYCRFINRKPDPRRYMFVTRIVVISLMVLTACLVPMVESIEGVWKFFGILTVGYGIISFARWFWWRINAFTEIAALALGLVAACIHGVLITWFPESLVIGGVPWSELDFPLQLALLTFIVIPICLLTTFLTPPTQTDTLEAFYRRVRPGGFWGGISKETRALPGKVLSMRTWLDVAGGLGLCFGISLAIGYFLLTRHLAMVICLIITCIGAVRVVSWYRREVWELTDAHNVQD